MKRWCAAEPWLKWHKLFALSERNKLFAPSKDIRSSKLSNDFVCAGGWVCVSQVHYK